MINIFGDDIGDYTQKAKDLYKLISKSLPIIECEYSITENNVIYISFDGMRYSIICDLSYKIYDCQRANWNNEYIHIELLKDVPEHFRKIFGYNYHIKLQESRTKKLNRILK